MKEKEIWKRIPWAKDYEISNWGRVKSYKIDTVNGRLMKLTPNKSSGYIIVSIRNNEGILTPSSVHSLVAEAFIPNPENKDQINHIDEDKTNNYYKNLNWMTAKENINYGTSLRKRSETQGKAVRCIETGEIYYSISEAWRKTGIWNIHAVCEGCREMAKGFHWEYIN